MHYFYILQQAPGTWVLEESELRHCYRVLRHREGDEVAAIDGLGYRYHIRLGREGQPVQVLQRTDDPHEHYGRVAILFPLLKKTEALSWLVEKATELGATDLYPALTARCERKDLPADRLQRVMVAAMKQCGRSRMPQLHPLQPWPRLMADATLPHLRYIPHLEATEPLAHHQQALAGQDVVFAIGPEGDFTPQEVEQAAQAGFVPVLMGHHRLRAETAVAYALSVIKTVKGY